MAGRDLLGQLIRKRDQVDKLLQRAVPALITLTDDHIRAKGSAAPTGPSPTFSRAWSPDDVAPGMLTRAICSATLHRVWTLRRRFEWLSEDKIRKSLHEAAKGSAAPFYQPGAVDFEKYSLLLSSTAYGALNPVTASQVFRVLVYGGEQRAHTGLGFLAFFSMVWSLRRKYPEGFATGARLEPWHPTAYVTAKCLFPIQTLADVCHHRANLFEEIADSLKTLNRLATGDMLADRWNFARELSQLSTRLSEMSRISLVRKDFSKTAAEIAKIAGELHSTTRSRDVIDTVNDHIVSVLNSLGIESRKSYESASVIVEEIRKQLLPLLKDGKWDILADRNIACLRRPALDPYWADHESAATVSLDVCGAAVSELDISATACADLTPGSDSDRIINLLTTLAGSNRRLSSGIENVGLDAAKWCLYVVEREMAYATASNNTDFDPAELVSALVTAIRWRKLTSQPAIAAAVRIAITGTRTDGSWASGQPFYTLGSALVAHPITSDIVWTLASALKEKPEVEVADDSLDRYVGWLERTATRQSVSLNPRLQAIGWGSEKSRERDRIAPWPTALAINALLEIRDILEVRVWQLCEKTFAPVGSTTPLAELDPVDLDAVHGSRLHARVIEMSRKAASDQKGKAAYSFVFHGPPGSSKTAMAQALAGQMWRETSRRQANLVRITPADFTRHGEDRIESEARYIFDLLRHVRRVVILFDEVDDLLRRRVPFRRLSYLELLSPAMLNRLADLRAACPRQEICFIFSTNFIDQIEPALLRRGRVDAALPVVYSDGSSRRLLIEKMLKEANDSVPGGIGRFNSSAFVRKIVKETRFWPWMNINNMLKEMKSVLLRRPIAAQALNKVLGSHSESVQIPPYEARRLLSLTGSPDLRNELLQYSFSGWNSARDYRKQFTGQFCGWLRKSGVKTMASKWRALLADGGKRWETQGRPGPV